MAIYFYIDIPYSLYFPCDNSFSLSLSFSDTTKFHHSFVLCGRVRSLYSTSILRKREKEIFYYCECEWFYSLYSLRHFCFSFFFKYRYSIFYIHWCHICFEFPWFSLYCGWNAYHLHEEISLVWPFGRKKIDRLEDLSVSLSLSLSFDSANCPEKRAEDEKIIYGLLCQG